MVHLKGIQVVINQIVSSTLLALYCTYKNITLKVLTMSILLADLNKYCRWCLGKGDMKPIFSSCLGDMFQAIFSRKIEDDPSYPQLVCNRCIMKLSTAFNFHQTVLKSRKIIIRILEENQVQENQNVKVLDVPQHGTIEESNKQETTLTDFESMETFESNDHDYILQMDSQESALMFEASSVENDNGDEVLMSDNGEEKDDGDEAIRSDNGEEKETATEQGRRKCNHCPFIFNDKTEMKGHLQTHKVVCKVCLRTVYQHNMERHLETHKEQVPRPFRCEHCQHGFLNARALYQHVRSYHSRRNKGAEYLCSRCGHKVKTLSGFKKHTNTCTGRNMKTCGVCDKKFNKNYFVDHLKTHDVVKPYLCEGCNVGFSQLSNLRKHQRLLHTTDGQYRCTGCDDVFNTREARLNHLRSAHGLFRCHRCKISFQDDSSLEAHKVERHSKKKKKTSVSGLASRTVSKGERATTNTALSTSFSGGVLVLKVWPEPPGVE